MAPAPSPHCVGTQGGGCGSCRRISSRASCVWSMILVANLHKLRGSRDLAALQESHKGLDFSLHPELPNTRKEGVIMSIERTIYEKLSAGLQPLRLDVINESELHAGHRNSPGTGESHFRVLVVSESMRGKSRVERHRLVNDLLSHELKNGVHALAIKAYAPGESILP